MEWIYYVIYAVGACVFFWLSVNLGIAIYLYYHLLVRTKDDKWSRTCSEKDDEEQVKMYDLGEEWAKPFMDKKIDVKITNDGFDLYGEYLDFGFDKTVIIIPGRTEGCRYSYFFAPPYYESKYNILVIDNRCHGLSGGKFNCLGLKEYKDILAWAKFINETYKIDNIVLHGICIGSATALYALLSDNCPKYLKAMVADGMYVNFKESTKNHIIEMKKPVYPCLSFFILIFRLRTRRNPVKNGPIKLINKLDRPILFIYSVEDLYSTKEKGQLLYDTCTSKKRIRFFPKGAHSRVRINNTIDYDKTIIDFLNDVNDGGI